MQGGAQALVRLQRRVRQLEQELCAAERARAELLGLLERRHASGAVFPPAREAPDAEERLRQQRAENEQLRGQCLELQALSEQQAQTIAEFHRKLSEMLGNARQLQRVNADLNSLLMQRDERIGRLEAELAEERLLSQQLVEAQAEIAQENEAQERRNRELQLQLASAVAPAAADAPERLAPDSAVQQTLPPPGGHQVIQAAAPPGGLGNLLQRIQGLKQRELRPEVELGAVRLQDSAPGAGARGLEEELRMLQDLSDDLARIAV